MTMEMHELEQAWSALDARVGEQNALLRRLETGRTMDKVRSRMRLASVGQIVQLVIGLLIVLWAGGYWWDHLGGPAHVVVYGIGLHIYGLALLIAAAVQLARVATIDYRKPVMVVQKQLLGLRRVRVQSERVLLMIGFIAWVPLLFVVLRSFGMDVWLTRPAVVLWNLGAGVLMAAGVALLMRRFPGSFERDAAGASLREAEAELAELGELAEPPRDGQ
jgi:hypothetical protein